MTVFNVGQQQVHNSPTSQDHRRPVESSLSSGTSSSTSSSSNVFGAGQFIMRLAAYDVDSGDNAVVSYSIAHGNERGVFAVVADTGVLTVSPAGPGLDRLSAGSGPAGGSGTAVYRLVVAATDSGKPQNRSTFADLEVRIMIVDRMEGFTDPQTDAGELTTLRISRNWKSTEDP